MVRPQQENQRDNGIMTTSSSQGAAPSNEAAPSLTSSDLVGLIANRDRLRVVAALVLGANDLPSIRHATGLEYGEVNKALHRLEDKGLVDRNQSFEYVLLAEAFQLAARADAQSRPRETLDEHGDLEAPHAKVLRTFVRNGRLIKIPTPMAKKAIVFEHLAQSFEPGEKYSEAMVNLVLGKFHPDTAALRRYLVDFGFLDRADGQYWRSGGRTDP